MESFEDFIREQSDEFRMYPSKRVWYSLYNNLHPGRKWPSISMCIVLLTALFLIGFLNGGSNYNNARLADKGKVSPTSGVAATAVIPKNPAISGTSVVPESLADIDVSKFTFRTIATNQPKRGFGLTEIAPDLPATQPMSDGAKNIAANKNSAVTEKTNDPEKLNRGTKETDLIKSLPDVGNIDESVAKTAAFDLASSQPAGATDRHEIIAAVTPGQVLVTNNEASGELTTPAMDASKAATASTDKEEAIISDEQIVSIGSTLSPSDKSWIENYALYNRPSPKKWRGKLALQAYLAPSVSYRKLFNNAVGKSTSNPAAGISRSLDASLNTEVTQSASVGLEGGVALQYPLLKGIKVKAGLQLNYTRYNIAAYSNSHPTSTSLEMNSKSTGQPFELYKATVYSNYTGLTPVTLHSQTLQLSVPVGADIKLAGNDLLEWYAGAALQPTVVFAASSFLISTDRRNYVKDQSMLNHFNVNAAFETYLSFKSAGGITWQIGPQFRKQLYSTSTRLYSIEERLLGYGLKIGVVKKF